MEINMDNFERVDTEEIITELRELIAYVMKIKKRKGASDGEDISDSS